MTWLRAVRRKLPLFSCSMGCWCRVPSRPKWRSYWEAHWSISSIETRVQAFSFRSSLQERGEGKNAGSAEGVRLRPLPCLPYYHTSSFQQSACRARSSFRLFLRGPTTIRRQGTATLQRYQSDDLRGVACQGSAHVHFSLSSMPTLVFLFEFL